MDPAAPGRRSRRSTRPGDAGPPRARACGSGTPCCRTRSATRCVRREGGDGPRPRDRWPVRARAGRRLVRERARPVRHRPAADRRADRPPDLRRGGDPGRCSRPRPPPRPASPATTRSTRSRGATNLPAAAHARAARRSSSAARSPRGIRLAARRGAGLAAHRAPRRATSRYFAAKRDELVRALEDEGRDPATFEFVAQVAHRAPTPPTGHARSSRPAGSSPPARRRSCSGIPAALGPARRSRPRTATCSRRSATRPRERRPTRSDVDSPSSTSTTRRGSRRTSAIRNASPARQPGLARPTSRGQTATYPGEGTTAPATEATGGTAVGAASDGPDLHVPARRTSGAWLGLWVVPEARRQGIGTALLRACRRGGPGRGQDRVRDRALRGARGRARASWPPTASSRSSGRSRSRLDLRRPRGAGPAAPRRGSGSSTLADAAGPPARPSTGWPSRPFHDIPSARRAASYAGTFDEFVARDVDRPGICRARHSSSPSTRRPARSAGFATLMSCSRAATRSPGTT